MKKIGLLLIACFLLQQNLFAQFNQNYNRRDIESRRGEIEKAMYKRIYPDSAVSAVCFSMQGALQLPAGNLYNRYGFSKTIGLSIYYKSKSNFCIGALGNYFFGNEVKEQNLFANISSTTGGIIMDDGDLAETKLYERGFYFGPTIGYISNKLLSSNKNTGLSFWLTGGYIEHRIVIEGDAVTQLTDAYKVGYDRLSAGFFVQQGIMYNHMSVNHLVNYQIGIEILEAFTHGLRTVNFDTGESGHEKRFDVLMGLKAAWFLPVRLHSKKEQEFTF